MYQFYLTVSKINEKVNTLFISPVTLTSYFDVALNKRNAGQGSVFCVWVFHATIQCLSGCEKMVSEIKCPTFL